MPELPCLTLGSWCGVQFLEGDWGGIEPNTHYLQTNTICSYQPCLCMSKPSTSCKKIHATLSNVTVTIRLTIRPNCQNKVMNQCISVDICTFNWKNIAFSIWLTPCKLKILSMVQNNLTWDSWPLIYLVSDFLTFFRIRTIRSLHLTDISGHYLAKQFFLVILGRGSKKTIYEFENYIFWTEIISYATCHWKIWSEKNVTVSVCVHE